MKNGVRKMKSKNDFKFCTIDSSTKKTGMALFINGKYQNHLLIDVSKEGDTSQRCESMGVEICKVLDTWKPDAIYIEHPQGHGRNVDMVFKLTLIIGVVFGWAIHHNCFFKDITPSEWRKLVGIKQGQRKRAELKADSIKLADEVFGIICNDDVADALAMGYGVIKYYEKKEN